MKLNQLKYFMEVSRGGTLSQAARKAGVSQPCISSSIRCLEEEFGFPLLHNEKNRLSLTEEGRVIAAYAEDLLQECEAMENYLIRMADMDRILRVGAPARLAGMAADVLLSHLQDRYPEIQLEFSERKAQDIAQDLTDYTLDAGIVPQSSMGEMPAIFETIPLFTAEIFLCVHRDSPLSQHETSKLSALEGQSLLCMINDGLEDEYIQPRLQALGIRPKVVARYGQLDALRRMLLRNRGVAFLYGENLGTQESIRKIRLPELLEAAPVSLVVRKDMAHKDGVKKLLRLGRECY